MKLRSETETTQQQQSGGGAGDRADADAGMLRMIGDGARAVVEELPSRCAGGRQRSQSVRFVEIQSHRTEPSQLRTRSEYLPSRRGSQRSVIGSSHNASAHQLELTEVENMRRLVETERRLADAEADMRLAELDVRETLARKKQLNDDLCNKRQSTFRTCDANSRAASITRNTVHEDTSTNRHRDDFLNDGVPNDQGADLRDWVDEARARTPMLAQQTTAEECMAQTVQTMHSMQIEVKIDALKNVKSNGDRQMARQAFKHDLPVFSGRIEEWANFINEFRRTSAACEYTDEENMSRLQKSLRGLARDTVQALMYSAGNVGEIVDMLQSTFGRPECIIMDLINKARNIPCLAEKNFEEYVQFSNDVRNLVSTMESLDYTGHMTNPELLTEFIGKLPHYLKLQWAGHKVDNINGHATVKDFSIWLKRVAQLTNEINIPTLRQVKTGGTNVRDVPQVREKKTQPLYPKKNPLVLTTMTSEPASNEVPKNFKHI